MLNCVNLMGRLTREPELKYTPAGKAVVSFKLAVDRSYQKQGEERQADFINCVVWGKTAEFVANYFTKGQMMALSGRIETRSWDDNGVKRYATEVIAEEVYFADSKKSDSATPKAPAQTAPVQPAEDFTETEDDDLPF